MTQPTGTFSSYDAIGNREDLTDVIYNISPTDTPFMSNIGRTKAKATLHEWQTDSLASADTANAVIEGDDVSGATSAASSRVSNQTQISDKDVVISGTQEAVDKAGRKSELAYQLAKRAKELKRDMEAIISQEQNQAAGNDTTARKTQALEAWIETNANHEGTGSTSSGVVTDGVQRAITEDFFNDAAESAWTEGGDPDIALCGPKNKRQISAFSGIATLYRDTQGSNKQATILGAADVYITDFGEIKIVPSRFNRDRTVCIIQKDLWALAYLRPFQVHKLAKTGDAEKRQMIVEYCLVSRNEKGNAKIADLTTP